MVATIPSVQSGRRVPWRVLAVILGATAIHFALFMAAERFLVGRMLDRAFGVGVSVTPWERVVEGLDMLASLPLVKPMVWLHGPDPGNAAPLLFLLDSLCWGAVVGLIVKRRGSRWSAT